MLQPSHQEFAAASAAGQTPHIPFVMPPTAGDDRSFSVTPECSAFNAMWLGPVEASVMAALRRHGAASAVEVSRAARIPYPSVLAAMRGFAALGWIADVSPGSEGRSRDWQALCGQVAEAVSAFPEGMDVFSVKARDIKDMVPGRKFSEVKSALDALRLREASGKAFLRGRRTAAKVSAVTDKAASVADLPLPSRGRGRKATAPVTPATRRRFRVLKGLLGAEGKRFVLPELEVDARRMVSQMAEEVERRDPGAMSRATPKQMYLIASLVAELGIEHPGADVTKASASEFIAKWLPMRRATARQVGFATAIAQALGLEVPSTDGRHMYVEVAEFIRRNRPAFSEAEASAA